MKGGNNTLVLILKHGKELSDFVFLSEAKGATFRIRIKGETMRWSTVEQCTVFCVDLYKLTGNDN